MRRVALAALAAFVLAGLACAAAGQDVAPTSAPAGSGPEATLEATSQSATEAELAALVAANTAFGLDLYRQLAGAPGNLFLSPYSLSTALAMTYAGASGETATAMAETLQLELAPDRVHAAFERLAAELAARGADVSPEATGDRFELTVANALWPQAGFGLAEAFLRVQREHYGADPTAVDYQNATEDARQTINTWVSEHTHARIAELIAPGILTPEVRLVLTNAIYFNASWAQPFEPSRTQPGAFHAPAGDVSVPLMRRQLRAGLARVGDVTIVDLPYRGDEVVMTIVMPGEGELAAFERDLTSERLAAFVGALAYGRVDLTLPRFESGSAMSLREVLSALGMSVAFDPGRADLSGMTGARDLYVSEVVHEANLIVDETGTEAAAATAVIVAVRSVQAEPERVVVDRPFVYLIRDRATGAVLFLGRLVDPS